jgi:energy-coupling factor transport system ATP-binding protein
MLDSASFRYESGGGPLVPAIEELSLSVDTGGLLLVVGETGSGKSTLLRVAAGLLEPSSGSVSLDGEPLTRRSARGTIGLVFQDPESQLFADTVLQDVAFGPTNLGLDPEEARVRAEEALARVGLDSATYGRRSPFHLSGGESRRAAIAGVLAMRPRYLLFDEPTAGLDAGGRRAVSEIIAAERVHSGVVVVSHSAEDFLSQADQVAILCAGRVEFCGTPQRLMAEPEIFARAGLVAPGLLRLMSLGRERGLQFESGRMDPVEVADVIARSAGWV